MFSPKSQQRTWFIIDDLLTGNFHVPSPLCTQDFYKIFLHLNISLRAASLFFLAYLSPVPRTWAALQMPGTNQCYYHSAQISIRFNVYHEILKNALLKFKLRYRQRFPNSLRMRIAFLRRMWKSFNSPLVFSEGKWEAWNWVQWNLKVLMWKNKNNV